MIVPSARRNESPCDRLSVFLDHRASSDVGTDTEDSHPPRNSTNGDEIAKQFDPKSLLALSWPHRPRSACSPLFSATLARLPEHPVLSKPLAIRGIVLADGLPALADMSLGDQLRQRAAMGGEKEAAELAAFETLLSKCIADAVGAELHTEAEAAQVDVLTWLARPNITKA